MKPDINNIIAIASRSEFNQMALDIFNFQAKENEVYNQFIMTLKIKTDRIKEIKQIPFLPIEFFKSHLVSSLKVQSPTSKVFTSSGTTGSIQSKHFVSDVSVYEKSYLKAFQLFYGNIGDYCIQIGRAHV